MPAPLDKATAPKPDQKDQGEPPKEGQDKGAAKKEDATGPRSPGADPKFQALKKDVDSKKRTVGTSHPPARTEAGAAQAASVPPADDREARGKAAHAEDMDAAQPKEFNKAEFVGGSGNDVLDGNRQKDKADGGDDMDVCLVEISRDCEG